MYKSLRVFLQALNKKCTVQFGDPSLMTTCILSCLILIISTNTYGHIYLADVDEARWQTETSPLYCRLWQEIPAYGTGLFEHKAGERQEFQLKSRKEVHASGKALIHIVPPKWKFDQPARSFGVASTTTGFTPLVLKEPMASGMLDELEAGMAPQIDHPGWYPKHQVSVQLSSVNFTSTYSDYTSCLSDLYAANFDQLERTTVLFDTDKADIRAEYFERIKLIKGYLEVDPSVQQVIVDGHTDNMGSDGYNWDLSKKRAEAVAAYLRKVGIPEDKIYIRYHGEKFPVLKNSSSQARQKNRRTTLRLSKTTPTPTKEPANQSAEESGFEMTSGNN